MKNYILVISILFLVFACSGTSDKQYFDQAGNLVKEKKYKDAIAKYEELIKEFPDSKLAVKSLIEIARLYEARNVEGINIQDSYRKASDTYYLVYEKFPESEEAPVALFQSGFILDNELRNFDEATKRYNLFLEKYPNHKYAKIVQQSLDIMGLDPEEIINRKQAGKN